LVCGFDGVMAMENAPNLQVVLHKFEYTGLRVLLPQCGYIIHPQADATCVMKRWIFSTVRGIMAEVRQPPPMRILLNSIQCISSL
jgi:hypothetical protein